MALNTACKQSDTSAGGPTLPPISLRNLLERTLDLDILFTYSVSLVPVQFNALNCAVS